MQAILFSTPSSHVFLLIGYSSSIQALKLYPLANSTKSKRLGPQFKYMNQIEHCPKDLICLHGYATYLFNKLISFHIITRANEYHASSPTNRIIPCVTHFFGLVTMGVEWDIHPTKWITRGTISLFSLEYLQTIMSMIRTLENGSMLWKCVGMFWIKEGFWSHGQNYLPNGGFNINVIQKATPM